VLLGVGRVAYGVTLPVSTIPAVVVTALVGSATFCVLWLRPLDRDLLGGLRPARRSAIMLPLYFISGVFMPNPNLPGWLQDVARIFPVPAPGRGPPPRI
jgi:ABC-2 type transport system permease protein